MTVIIVAAVEVVINSITALIFVSGQKHDLNIKGAFLHMAADAGVSFGVVAAGIPMMTTDWLWVDPVVSLLVVTVILGGTWSLLRDSMNLAIDAVPGHIDMVGIKEHLFGLDKVFRIHDLHVWPISTTEVALTVHLTASEDVIMDQDFLPGLQKQLHDRFDIDHSTIQIEREGGNSCMLDN